MRHFSVYDIIDRNAKIYKNSPALKWGNDSLTFGEFKVQVDALASGLAEIGLGKGDRAAILALNHPRYLTLLGALASLGAVAVPVNWRLSDEEVLYIIEDVSPRILVMDESQGERIGEKVKSDLPRVRPLFFGSGRAGETGLDEWTMSPAESAAVRSETDDPFCIIHTAAVAGKPRGAVLSHGNLVFSNLQTISVLGLTPEDAYLNMLPLFHITGLNLAFSVMHAGGANVIMPKFDDEAVMRLTEKESITVWGSFPPMLTRLTERLSPENRERFPLKHVVGLDAPDNIRAFEEKADAVFWGLYGQTETSGMVTLSPANLRPGSAGLAAPLSVMQLADEAGNAVPAGESGEITTRGPLVFQGFWKDGDFDRSSFRNGWHHTGDMGQLDADGFLWFKGRKPEKELIKPGGENVYPAEVESVILEHPALAEVSVIGVADPEFGEGIKAVCVLKSGESLTAEALVSFVAERIARYKKPRYVVFADALPKKSDGTVDREKVKAEFGG